MGARLLVGFRVVINRTKASPLGIVPVSGRVELLSRTMGMGQGLRAESRLVCFLFEQGRVVVVCVAEDVPQEGGVWFGSIGGARAGSEGISYAIREIARLMDGTFCSSAGRETMTTTRQPWHLV
jgi:hypothetical protein